MLDWINRLFGYLINTFRLVFRGRIWLPLVLMLMVSGLLLFSHYRFDSSWAYWFMAPYISLYGDKISQAFQHYPGQFLLMPYLFGIARFVVGLLLEGFIFAGAAIRFYEAIYSSDRSERRSVRSLLPSWGNLVLASLLTSGLAAIINWSIPSIMGSQTEGSMKLVVLVEVLLVPLAYVIIYSLFYALVPAIAIYGDSFFGGLKRSFRVFRSDPLICLGFASVVLVGPVMVSTIVSHSDVLVSKFHPESVYWLLLTGLVAELFAGYFWMGTAVQLMREESD